MTIVVDLGCKATKQTNKHMCSLVLICSFCSHFNVIVLSKKQFFLVWNMNDLVLKFRILIFIDNVINFFILNISPV